jgi:uncharacterized protein (DUF2384 family)
MKKKKPTPVTYSPNESYDLQEVHDMAMAGLSPNYFYDLSKTYEFSEKELADIIGLSLRTIQNYKQNKKFIEGNYSEHLLKISKLYKLGLIIFRTSSEFNRWLSRPFKLSKVIAREYLHTLSGIDLLSQELNAIGEGYPV